MKKIFFLALCGLFIIACNKKEGNTNSAVANEAKVAMNEDDVVNKMVGNLANSSQGQVDLRNIIQGKTDVVAQKLLSVEQAKAFFPKNIGSFVGGDITGETNAVLGAPATFLKCEYRSGDKIARLALTDTGGSPKVLSGIANWGAQMINKDEDKYFERTRTFGGFPAYERVIKSSNANNFEYVIDNRWVITAQCMKIPIEEIYNLAGQFSPEALRKFAKK